MKQLRVAKLKLHATPEQFQALRAMQVAYRDALNYVSRYAFEHGKMSNKVRLQDGTYRDIRTRFKLPAQIAAGKFWYDKLRKQFCLLVSLQVEVAAPTPETHQQVVGIDVGQRYLAVVATPGNDTRFYSGRAIRAKADHYARLRKRLQKKGTRSATRRLVVISRRERRLKQDCNHRISRRIVDAHPHSIIGLEHLTDIRERIKRRKGKRASKKQRRANRHASKWACAGLNSYIPSQPALIGSIAIHVHAHSPHR